MAKQRMIFEIDRRSVTEGDVVEINWQCQGAEEVMLTIDNGFRATEIPLEPSGNKRFRLHRSKGKTHMTIAVTTNGKVHRKTIDVRVKKLPTVKAETVDGNGKRLGFFRQGWQRLLTKWHDATAKLRFAMSTLPEGKQVRVRMMALLGVLLIIGAIWPKLYGLTLVVLVVALAIGLIRK